MRALSSTLYAGSLLQTDTCASRISVASRPCASVEFALPSGPLFWIISEDANVPSQAVSALLAGVGLEHVHLATGPTGQKGHAQRSLAMELIRDHALDGVVYNMDDDNLYARQLWAELRRVGARRVGVLSVLMDTQSGYAEKPHYDQMVRRARARNHKRSHKRSQTRSHTRSHIRSHICRRVPA